MTKDLMKRKGVSRREFVRHAGLLTTAGLMATGVTAYPLPAHVIRLRTSGTELKVSTDFPNGGGEVSIIQQDPVVIRIKPHRQAEDDWSRVWGHFRVQGFNAGEQIILQLAPGEPASAGITPQACFTYDQQVWGRTDTGSPAEMEGRKFYIYKHVVRGSSVWFAYDLPYTPAHVESVLLPAAREKPGVEVFTLCRTRQDRPVHGLKLNATGRGNKEEYGIWFHARAHAFESGASWVLHELALWLLSDDPAASALREISSVTIVPIVDVDGVVEGRTGKNHPPYDHNRGWAEKHNHWPEVRTIQRQLSDMAAKDSLDMYIDFHGPAGLHHPYFIVPTEESLPHAKQRANRKAFFEALNSKPLDKEITMRQSMTNIYYSPRPWNRVINNSTEWVTMETTDHNISMTLEVNMNTPLSTREGYQAEAEVLGRAISNYFTQDKHKR